MYTLDELKSVDPEIMELIKDETSRQNSKIVHSYEGEQPRGLQVCIHNKT